ncbi:MAG TPA: RidA family protein [Vicinamibacteria bacterium]
MSGRADTKRRTVGSGVSWEEEYGYSRAVRVGDHIYVSGTTATGPDGPVAPGDPAGQARFALDKIEKAIRELGGSLGDVVRTRIYIARMADWEEVAKAHGERFGKIRPANTLIRADLVGGEYLVEIEAEAVVGTARDGE